MAAEFEETRISKASYLPIISFYAVRVGVVDEIDRLLHCEMELSPGKVVLAIILDALTGRSPLFRLREFFADKDMELLPALLICRLMERTMRLKLLATESTVTGWEKRQTSRPRYLMLTTKFLGGFRSRLIHGKTACQPSKRTPTPIPATSGTHPRYLSLSVWSAPRRRSAWVKKSPK